MKLKKIYKKNNQDIKNVDICYINFVEFSST